MIHAARLWMFQALRFRATNQQGQILLKNLSALNDQHPFPEF